MRDNKVAQGDEFRVVHVAFSASLVRHAQMTKRQEPSGSNT